jgi:hypothetical protein
MLQEEAYSFYFINRRSEVRLLSGPPNRLVKSDLFLISLVSTPRVGTQCPWRDKDNESQEARGLLENSLGARGGNALISWL